MAETVNISLDANLMNEMEQFCAEEGYSTTTVLTLCVKEMLRERRIPFTVKADPFYSESNLKELERRIKKYQSGKAKLAEHELIEVD